MIRRWVRTADGSSFDLKVDTGSGRMIRDFISGGSYDFGSSTTYLFAMFKGDDEKLQALYGFIRDISREHFNVLPIGMPITHASHQAIFVWDAAQVNVTEEQLCDILASSLSAVSLPRVKKSDLSRSSSGVDSTPYVSVRDPHKPTTPWRGRRRRGIRWGYVFVIFWLAALGLGLYLIPGTNVVQLAFESLFNASLFLFFVWGIAGLGRRSNARRAFAVLILLILVGVVYANQQATVRDVGLNGARSVYVAENSYLANYAASFATTTTNQATIPEVNVTVSTIPSIFSTTSVSAVAASSFSASTSSVAPVTGNWLVDNPSFVGGSAKIDTPPNYQTLLNFTLALINHDRATAGLSPVSLSPVQSGQQHADSMAFFGYLSHWDTQGYKPYMRYTLLGGTSAVAENAGMDSCTTSPPSDSLVTLANCSLQNIENGLANSEWQMVNNDALCCNNGHRDNILDPTHNRVSLGISYNETTGTLYLVEDFEDSYLQLSQPVQPSPGQIQIVGSGSTGTSISQIVVYGCVKSSAHQTAC